MAISKSKSAKALENRPDTRGIVGTAQGVAKTGHMRVSGNVPSRNSMVSANAARGGRGGMRRTGY